MSDFEEPIDDRSMDPEEEARTRSLTPAELQRIDTALLSNTTEHWKKVAMVIYQAMKELSAEIPSVPDVFYVQRVKHLARTGVIEAAGTLDRMRFIEATLPQNRPSAER